MVEELLPRVPPHNEEAERAVLGALLLSGDRVSEVAELLQPDDFYVKRHGHLYAALLALSERAAPIDFLSVAEALRAAGTFQAVGGQAYLLELSQSVTSAAHVVYHAQMVAQTALLRRLIAESTRSIEAAYAARPDGDSVKQLLDECEQRVFAVARGGEREGAASIHSLLQETFRKIDAKTNRDLTGLTTGFYELNDKLCGLNRGDLIIIAARPGMGKTAFALNLAENAALTHNEALDRLPTVLFFSLEMGKDQIVSRMLCSRAGVDSFKLRTGRIPPDERTHLTDAADELARSKIFIDDTPGLTVMSLRGRSRRIKAKHGLDLVIVDYLQLMSHPKAESRQMEISAISRSLKALARELDVPVVALSQLSRQVESREDKRPMLQDLRESGSIEQDADVVLMLFREEYYLPEPVPEDKKNKAEVIIAKHRNGPSGMVPLHFFPEKVRFTNPELSNAVAVFS
jgi:replicative DNA helicase